MSLCRRRGTRVAWKHLFQQEGSAIRFGAFVEVMAPAFRYDFFRDGAGRQGGQSEGAKKARLAKLRAQAPTSQGLSNVLHGLTHCHPHSRCCSDQHDDAAFIHGARPGREAGRG
jgi:hypothetical protein